MGQFETWSFFAKAEKTETRVKMTPQTAAKPVPAPKPLITDYASI